MGTVAQEDKGKALFLPLGIGVLVMLYDFMIGNQRYF